jgi:hypothetical protein
MMLRRLGTPPPTFHCRNEAIEKAALTKLALAHEVPSPEQLIFCLAGVAEHENDLIDHPTGRAMFVT